MMSPADLALTYEEMCRMVGVMGFLMYVANYVALSFRILSSESALYFAVNICAASMVLVSLSQDFNLASALIQSFWIVIGSFAILLRLRRRRALLSGRPHKRGL